MVANQEAYTHAMCRTCMHAPTRAARASERLHQFEKGWGVDEEDLNRGGWIIIGDVRPQLHQVEERARELPGRARP